MPLKMRNPPTKRYGLVTVNMAPERAKMIIGWVVEAVEDVYTIDYVANAESMYFLIKCITLACRDERAGAEVHKLVI